MSRQRLLLPAIVSLSIVLAGCDSFSLIGQFRRVSSLSLTLQASSLGQGQTINLYPAGGEPPYSFGLLAGSLFYVGTLGSITNQVYTAGTSIGTVTIHLTDADGDSVDSQVIIIPPTPTSFNAQADVSPSPHAIDLSWSYPDTSLISGYEIQRSLDNVTFTNLVSLPSSATIYVDSPLTPSQTYYYRIYAVSGTYQSLPVVKGSLPS